MNLISRFGDIFQLSYVTGDRDRTVVFATAKLGTIGIPALDVIRWATKHGAEAMGPGDQTGTVEPGKLADLLVVDGDPSVDITLLRDCARLLAIFKGGAAIKGNLTVLST